MVKNTSKADLAVAHVHLTQEEVAKYVEQALGKGDSYDLNKYVEICDKVSNCETVCFELFSKEWEKQTS